MKTFERDIIVVQEAFLKNQIQIFNDKMPETETKKDKNSKTLGFLMFLCNVCLIFGRLGVLEV